MAAAKNVAQNTDNILEYIISYNLKEFAKTLSALSEQDLRGLLSTELTLRHIAQQEFRNNPFVTKLVDYDIPKLSCFHIAALFGRTDMVGLAVTMGMSASQATDVTNVTAAHLASLANHPDLLQVLVEGFSAKVNVADRYGWTCLHYAASEGNKTMVEMLIGYGADVTTRDKDGTSPAFRAHVNNHSEIAAMLIELSNEDLTMFIEDNFSFLEVDDIQEVAHPVLDMADRKSASSVKYKTLPGKITVSKIASSGTLRRMIRNEIEATLDDYESPTKLLSAENKNKSNAEASLKVFKGIMKEELLRYKEQQYGYGPVNNGNKLLKLNNQDEISDAAINLPPLPPRTMSEGNNFLVSLANLVHTQWRKLAHALPACSTVAQTQKAIYDLESKHHNDSFECCLEMLKVWWAKRRTIEQLCSALQSCDIYDKNVKTILAAKSSQSSA